MLKKLSPLSLLCRITGQHTLTSLQVDTMHSEIAQRVDLQDKLYHQNDVMFTYIAELLKAQKKNSRTMKTHVVALQQEVCTLHQEREVLVSKVTEAMTTKEAIRNIEVQQQQLEERVLVAQQARREAVAAGQQQEQHNQVDPNRKLCQYYCLPAVPNDHCAGH